MKHAAPMPSNAFAATVATAPAVSTVPVAPAASRVIADLARAINQSPDVQGVQAMVVEKAMMALGASTGSVMMPGSEPGRMRVVAAIGLADTYDPEAPPESPVAEWVVENDQPVLLLGRTGPLAHLLHREHIRDAVCVPLRGAGRVLGALSVSNSQNREPFHQGDVDLLTSIGHLAAVALENATLYEEAEEHRARVQAVLHQLWTAQEDERRCLAGDLHDGPAQGLFHIVFQLQTARGQVERDPLAAAETLARAESAARETLAHLRAIMTGLRPMSLDDLGLVPTLQGECAGITGRGRVEVVMTVSGEPRRLGLERETGIFRIAREALSNVERHSGSDRARLSVRFDRDGLTLVVEDWGKGFDDEAVKAARLAGHIGLSALEERAQALGMALEIASDVGRGTRITLHCPPDAPESTQDAPESAEND